MNAPARHRRIRRLGQSSLESSALGLSDSNEVDSSNSSSKGSSNGSDSGDDKGKEKEEEEDDDDEGEEMEYLAPNYPQEDSGDDTPMRQSLLKLLAIEPIVVSFLFVVVVVVFFFFF